MQILERLFKLRENKTTVSTELRGGLVTFLTMSYIIFVQPAILSSTGLSWHTVFVATCVASAVSTVLMALFSNYPIALAPAMGHNMVFVMYCMDGTINWQTGLGALVISGTIFIVFSFWGLREKVIHVIPSSLKHAIAVGIGLLIAFLGFQWSGLMVAHPNVLVKLGNLHSTPVLLSIGGLLLTAALVALRVRGAILIGIVVTALVGIPLGITSTKQVAKGILTRPPDPMKTVAILPVRAPGLPAGEVDAISSSLDRAVREHYAEDKLIPSADVQRSLYGMFAEPGAKLPAELISRMESAGLRPGIIILTWVGKEEGRPPALRVNAYTVQQNKTWREYPALAWPASPKQLEHYAKDMALGLPDHDGLFKMDVLGALRLGLIQVIFVFFFLDMFDTIGTLIGVSQQAGLLVDGKLPRARGALLADACGTVIGAVTGTSTITSYVESSAGVAEGARTGLANLIPAALFIVALFFAPVVQMIGGECVIRGEYGDLHLHPAVAPILILIGSIMLRNVVHIVWTDATEALPAFLSITVMLTFSITEGISFGFISYCFLKLITGRGREVHWLLYLFSVLFIVRYVVVGT